MADDSPTRRMVGPFAPNIQNIPIRTEEGRKLRTFLAAGREYHMLEFDGPTFHGKIAVRPK